MPLREYHRKRAFERTPEPEGSGKGAFPGRQFVVQKHAARQLHYDFRLELDGVLKSWAVPKGPSLDPSIKSLAVHVEDHPLEYATFEGVIPEEEYGGGTVMVWDHGTWDPAGDPQKAYQQGRLKFQLNGEKLRGAWTLVRMTGKASEDGKNWLLIKKGDDAARPAERYDVLAEKPRSVLSGRDLETIADHGDRVWSSKGKQSDARQPPRRRAAGTSRTKPGTSRKPASREPMDDVDLSRVSGARKAAMPSELKPQLATLSQNVPDGDGWLHEIKFDGYRILAFLQNGKARLVTRNANDWTQRFSAVARQLERLPVNRALVDGEVVALKAGGVTSSQKLQNWLKRGKCDKLVYYAFDLVHLNGYDLTRVPLLERKELLARRLLGEYSENDGPIRYSDHIQGDGPTVVEQICRHALEGVISKRADGRYQQGRSRQWLKIKCLKRQEFVIGGYTRPSGSRKGFGALLLGYYQGSQLKYCGRVGTGFTNDSLRQITAELAGRKTEAPAFINPPSDGRRGITWVKPELVCEVEFSEWTEDDRLRHPSFQGLREDKPPEQVGREELAAGTGESGGSSRTAVAAKSWRKVPDRPQPKRGATMTRDSTERVAGVRLTNPDRVLYPQQGITKRHLAEFYETVADWILPYIVDRPLTLVRCPKGHEQKCFYQKHLTESMPDALRGVLIEEKKERHEYVVVDDLPGLIALVQMGVLEVHPWPACTDDLEHPDQLVFDLDPGEGAPWKGVVEGARDVRDELKRCNLQSFLRTSGGKGLHVVAPLDRQNTWDEVKGFAKSVAVRLEEEAPDRYTSNMSKAKRRGKVFVDYLRNQRGATAVACYSTRARHGAPVATPIRWDELSPQLASNKYTVDNLPRRLSALGSDPWEDFASVKQSVRAG